MEKLKALIKNYDNEVFKEEEKEFYILDSWEELKNKCISYTTLPLELELINFSTELEQYRYFKIEEFDTILSIYEKLYGFYAIKQENLRKGVK